MKLKHFQPNKNRIVWVATKQFREREIHWILFLIKPPGITPAHARSLGNQATAAVSLIYKPGSFETRVSGLRTRVSVKTVYSSCHFLPLIEYEKICCFCRYKSVLKGEKKWKFFLQTPEEREKRSKPSGSQPLESIGRLLPPPGLFVFPIIFLSCGENHPPGGDFLRKTRKRF